MSFVGPFDELKRWLLILKGDLNTGDTPGMDTRARIEIRRVSRSFFSNASCSNPQVLESSLGQREVFVDRAVGVACNHRMDAIVIGFGPLVDAVIKLIRLARVVRRPRRIFEATSLKAAPEVANKELAHMASCPVTRRVKLMPVQQQKTGRAVEYGALIDSNAGKQVVQQGPTFLALPEQVVIAPYFYVAGVIRVRIVKLSQPVVNRRMRDVDLSKCFVLPEFLGVAEFDKREVSFEIVIKGAFEDEGVVGKVVGPCAVTTVHVGHHHDACLSRRRNLLLSRRYGERRGSGHVTSPESADS